MSWLDYFLRRRIKTELVEAAQAIAVRHRIAVWERVEDTVPQMSPSEARGYIRARAATIVHSEADKVIAGHDLLTDAQLPLLVAAATDAVIADILVERNRRRTASAAVARAA
jgi:hypothetical protein